jgi:excisionase family DNA binding protein
MDTYLVSVEEAARLLSMSRAKVYDLVLQGLIPSVKVGRSRRVLVEGIQGFIEQLQVEQAVDDRNPVAHAISAEITP